MSYKFHIMTQGQQIGHDKSGGNTSITEAGPRSSIEGNETSTSCYLAHHVTIKTPDNLQTQLALLHDTLCTLKLTHGFGPYSVHMGCAKKYRRSPHYNG